MQMQVYAFCSPSSRTVHSNLNFSVALAQRAQVQTFIARSVSTEAADGLVTWDIWSAPFYARSALSGGVHPAKAA